MRDAKELRNVLTISTECFAFVSVAMTADFVTETALFIIVSQYILVAGGLDSSLPETATQHTSQTNNAVNSTSQTERRNETSSATYHYMLRRDDVTMNPTASSDADVTALLRNMTSLAPAALVQQPKDIGSGRTHRLLQVPDPGERWHHASLRRNGIGIAAHRREKQDLEHKTRSTVIVISSVFFTLTVVSTLALFIFCRKRNTVFVLQKCEQSDYAAAAAADDGDDEDEELSTDCDSTPSHTVVTRAQVDRHISQRRRELNRTSAVPMTPDLSLFCTSQTGKRNSTGRGYMRRDKVSSRTVSEVRSSWVGQGPAMTLSTTVPVECTDDDTDDDIKYRLKRDVMSASSLLRCDIVSTSGLRDDDASRCRRSMSLETDVCRFALTCGAISSQPLMSCKDNNTTRPDQLHHCQLTGSCSPCRQLDAGDVTDDDDVCEQLELSTLEHSTSMSNNSHCHDNTLNETTT